ncbi:FGGY family carbohydrate kinase [Saccharopolyspora gloriosae]|uniref:Sugar (Pentulose or hexulose) kinase n=1 Tax=Saccharopolyspora gloriosae TaxID=455344 RepID=A0A840NIB0_9PSEU|nr:sugar (pentulose or hexulose) kinase [Saccharopolyspora gloriosae]
MEFATTEAVVGIDVGSTEIKVLVTDRRGGTLSLRRTPTDWRRTADGHSELPAELLLGRVLSTVSGAVQVAERSAHGLRVTSVAITGMAESGVLLDRRGTPMHPIIAWFDQRGGAELAALPGDLVREFSARTGLPLSPLCSFAKLNRLVEQGLSPRRAGRWLNVPEYVAHALGGAAVTEPSLASRTGLLDQATRSPWSPALEHLGLSAAVLPPLTPAGTPIGTVDHPDVPESVRGAVLSVAGHDHPVASVASGVWHGEHLFDSCGTSEALLRVASAPLRDDQRARLTDEGIAQGMHVLPGRWILLGGTRGGLLLDQVLALLGRKEQPGRAELDEQWLSEPPEGAAIQVSGAHARSEHVDVRLGGDGATPLRVWSAALSHAMAETDAVIALMAAEAGPHEHVTAAGGWTRMGSFRAAKQRSLPEVRYSRLDQPSAYGAAIFAARAAAHADGETAVSAVDIARQFTDNALDTIGAQP